MNDKFKNLYRVESARLKNWDYRSNSAYFVTICTDNREHFFGEIKDGNMRLSNVGIIAENFCREIPQHFKSVSVDEFVIMPNHVHCIININRPEIKSPFVETLHATSLKKQVTSLQEHAMSARKQNTTSPQKKIPVESSLPTSPKPGSLSAIIRSYKSIVTKHAREIRTDFAWHSRFYDHIIRDEESFENIRNYIKMNPMNWANDEFNV